MLEKKKGKLAKSMIDEIWPIENIAIQKRALVKFTEREIKTRAAVNATQKQKNRKAINQIRKDIVWFRNMLAGSLLGPRQAVHNILRERKDLQLAYQNCNAEELIGILWEMNCSKKKLLDQLVYCRKKRTDVLCDYEGVPKHVFPVKSRHRNFGWNAIPSLPNVQRTRGRESKKNEKKQHIENLERGSDKLVSNEVLSLTNRVHNMEVKKDAANLINKMFKEARYILKRDTVFFDNVLSILEKHTENELKFIIKITEMGQNATEEHANLEEEYEALEKTVKTNMTDRERQVRALAREVQILEESYTGLVRTEKDESWEKHSAPTKSEMKISNDISALQDIMLMLQSTAHVSTCEDIFKRLKQQVPRRVQLNDTVLYMEHVREAMLTKRSHAELLAASLENKLLDSTKEYKETKAALLEGIAQEEEEIQRCTNELEKTGNLMVTIRTSLQTLFDIMECVKPEKDHEMKGKREPINEDAHVIMKLAKFKLRDLIELVPPEAEPSTDTVETARAVFQRKMAHKIAKAQYQAEKEVELALDIQELDDPQVVTRAAIKERSEKIVAAESTPQYL